MTTPAEVRAPRDPVLAHWEHEDGGQFDSGCGFCVVARDDAEHRAELDASEARHG